MREMVLNHASVRTPGSDRDLVVEWLKDVARGMARLVRDKVSRKSLRTKRDFHDTLCLSDYSLYDAFVWLKKQGFRDEHVFLVQLATKMPLLGELGEDVEDRFHACEERTLAGDDGEPLVLCAITDWITIGFPSESVWDRDRVTVDFDELLPGGTIEEASEDIDQLTRSAHAEPICTRHRDRLRAGSDPLELWENRQIIFPNLLFGPDVEDNLKASSHLFNTIVGKLVSLDQSAGDWRGVGGSEPPWGTKVTRESDMVMNNPTRRTKRKFRSCRGTQEIFEWHARFGSNGRIHLRFDSNSRKIEIGYIGPHLPL